MVGRWGGGWVQQTHDFQPGDQCSRPLFCLVSYVSPVFFSVFFRHLSLVFQTYVMLFPYVIYLVYVLNLSPAMMFFLNLTKWFCCLNLTEGRCRNFVAWRTNYT